MPEGVSGPPVLTPVDPRMNKRPKTMNIFTTCKYNTPDYRGDNLRHNVDLVNTKSGAIFVLQGKIFPS